MYFTPLYSPIGNHAQLTGLSVAKTIDISNEANGVIIQAISQNVRITLKGPVSGVAGFRIRAGDPPVLIPCGGGGSINVQEETASATVEYQAVKVHGTR